MKRSKRHDEQSAKQTNRRVLKDLQAQGGIECLGGSRNAKWNKTGNVGNKIGNKRWHVH